jgi:hypothetical protein
MSDSREKRAREIQKAIGEILMQHWDPIGVSDISEAQDEYDSYIGHIYRLLASSRSAEELVSYLSDVEAHTMGLGWADSERIRNVSSRLLALDVSL